MKESAVETHLRRTALQAGGRSYKWTSPGVRGVPDQIVMLPGCVLCFVEVKRPGEVPTDQQRLRHRELMDMGQRVAVVSSTYQADLLIEALLLGRLLPSEVSAK